jgi:hypothetical protein
VSQRSFLCGQLFDNLASALRQNRVFCLTGVMAGDVFVDLGKLDAQGLVAR